MSVLVFRDRENRKDWRVERHIGEDIEGKVFRGSDAHDRAVRYAKEKYGTFEEVELEAYEWEPVPGHPHLRRHIHRT